jgi:uncharacterized membrane protein
MIMSPSVRKFALTAHVTSSIGWLGAALAFLAVAGVGLTSPDAQTVRGVYLVMEPAAWLVLVPFAFASLLTGLVISLGTTWGLFRHYWVVFKLLITVFSTTVLLIYMETFRHMAGVAADPSAEIEMVRNASPALHAVLATLLLLTATVLAVYKPKGLTAYGRRKLPEQSVAADRAATVSRERWLYIIGVVALAIALLVVLSHLTGGDFGHHMPAPATLP